MKKISSLLLVLCMLLLLAACTTTDTTDISKYQAAIDATEPTTVRVTTTFTSSVFSGVILNGEYDVTIADDGSATVEYTYEELNEGGVGAEGFINTVPGSATISADGTVSADGELPASVTAAKKLAIKLDSSKLKSVVEARGILTAEVLAANTEAVLGFKVDTDVSLELRITADGRIGSASINYTTADGHNSVVVTYE